MTGDKTPDASSRRPTSVVKFSKELQVEEIPARSRSALTPSKSGIEDVMTSRSSMGGQMSEVRAFSQDAIREREKINTEALKGYAGLDMRYYDMIGDLIRVDNTYQILTGQLPAEEEQEVETVKEVTVIDTINQAFLTQADESFIVEDGEEVTEGEQSSTTTDNKLSGEHIKVVIDRVATPDGSESN